MNYLSRANLFVLIIVYGGTNAKSPVLKRAEEQPHQRLTFYNWDYKDLNTNAFEYLSPSAPQPTPLPINQSDHCPNGWLNYSNSCYFFETEPLGFAKAESKCRGKRATLFVANSLDEWDFIRRHAKVSFFSWIGLVRLTYFERQEQLPRWQTTGSINPSKLNWLIKPFNPLANGWSSIANCATIYQSPSALDATSYTFFYPCTLQFNSICERNSTILSARN